MKRKDFSNIKIEVQKEKNTFFEHENFIAGTPPFLRGIHSFPQENHSLASNTQNTVIKLDINNLDFNNKINLFIENQAKNSTISISNKKAINSEIEIAQLLFKVHNSFSEEIKKGLKIDLIASKISFSWSTTNYLPYEIAKIRATRLLWAKMVNQFQPKKPKSLALKIHIEGISYLTSFISITGGTQNTSTQNNSNTFIDKTIDPWAGSTTIEELTENFIKKTWKLFLTLST